MIAQAARRGGENVSGPVKGGSGRICLTHDVERVYKEPVYPTLSRLRAALTGSFVQQGSFFELGTTVEWDALLPESNR